MARPNHARAMAVMTAMAAAALLMVLVAPGLGRAQSAGNQIAVDTTDDTTASDGACSLREAMTNANNNDQSGSTDCPAGSVVGEDSIVFSVGSPATITLGSRLPFITDAAGLAIDGGSAGITISGNDAVSLFQVNQSAKLALHNLTVADGRDFMGGAISNHGALTVTDSTFSGNSTSSNGGGIYTDRTATVRNSIVAGNTAPSDPNISRSITGGFNFIGGDALLGPLQDNGGPTKTLAPSRRARS